MNCWAARRIQVTVVSGRQPAEGPFTPRNANAECTHLYFFLRSTLACVMLTATLRLTKIETCSILSQGTLSLRWRWRVNGPWVFFGVIGPCCLCPRCGALLTLHPFCPAESRAVKNRTATIASIVIVLVVVDAPPPPPNKKRMSKFVRPGRWWGPHFAKSVAYLPCGKDFGPGFSSQSVSTFPCAFGPSSHRTRTSSHRTRTSSHRTRSTSQQLALKLWNSLCAVNGSVYTACKQHQKACV